MLKWRVAYEVYLPFFSASQLLTGESEIQTMKSRTIQIEPTCLDVGFQTNNLSMNQRVWSKPFILPADLSLLHHAMHGSGLLERALHVDS